MYASCIRPPQVLKKLEYLRQDLPWRLGAQHIERLPILYLGASHHLFGHDEKKALW